MTSPMLLVIFEYMLSVMVVLSASVMVPMAMSTIPMYCVNCFIASVFCIGEYFAQNLLADF